MQTARVIQVRIRQLHGWDVELPEALELQRRLSRRVMIRPFEKTPRLVAGVEAAYEIRGDRLWAAAVVFDLKEDRIIEELTVRDCVKTAYRPGLLAFREGPALLEVCRRIRSDPEVLIFDGHGLLHPRRLGMASHMGLFLEKPTVGCAKSALYREVEAPGKEFGERTAIMENGAVLGYALRTRSGVKPVYVSPGHLMDADSAVRVILQCVRGMRLPEPLRRAHHRAGAQRGADTADAPCAPGSNDSSRRTGN
ncbi:MAG: endonuclease V [Deltaproteobacteria bacterium]|nr:endonuclease V [Deltaproteobacteria bacterium]